MGGAPRQTIPHCAERNDRVIINAKGAEYKSELDALGRKIKGTYPPTAGNPNPSERFWYNAAGNMTYYQNPAGQVKDFYHDERNRLRHTWWDGNVGPDVVTNFDWASRVTDITTYTGGTNVETVVAFGYDDANRQIWEEQTLAGYPTRFVETLRDDDGNRSGLWASSNGQVHYGLYYGHDQRNQLSRITGGDNGPIASFIYDKAGNMTRRVGEWFYPNATWFTYDALNRPATVDQGDANALFQHNHYQYDKAGREVATWRDEDGKGERFWYNTANHLTRVVYKANNVWTENPSGWATFRDYHYAPDLLNWTSVNANGNLSSLANNSMNQFTSVNGVVPSYDGNFNQTTNHYGQTFAYNAANQVVGGSIQATYDGLGRCVRRTVGGVTTLFTYDNWNPILEWDQGGNFKARNIYGTKPDEILGRYDAVYGPLIYKQDKQGSVTFLLNGDNQIIEKYIYDAFGRPTILSANNTQLSTSAVGNRFMFTGREWLAQINAYDYRHRLYDPDLGRFLQTDPVGLQTEGAKLSVGQKALFSPGFTAPEAFTTSEMNLFRYCGDDPIDNSDPWGLLEIKWKESGNATDPKIENHYTDEKLRANNAPAAGKTTHELSTSGNKDNSVTVDLKVDWKVRRDLAEKDKGLAPREKQHADRWHSWVERMMAPNSDVSKHFSDKNYASPEEAAKAVRNFLEQYRRNESFQQKIVYDLKGGPHDVDYRLKD